MDTVDERLPLVHRSRVHAQRTEARASFPPKFVPRHPFELVQSLAQRTYADFDPTTAEAKAAWEAAQRQAAPA